MNYYPLLLTGLLLGLSACREASTEQKLIGKWQETEVINPQLSQMLVDQKSFADTIGNSTSPQDNLRMYGVANIDSLKRGLMTSIDSFRLQQDAARRSTVYEFLPGGKMYLHTVDGTDSCSWSVDEDGALLMDEGKLKGSEGMKLRMEILEVSDTLLKLQYNEKYLSSTTIFRPVKK